MKKKILAIGLSLVLTLGLAGCSSAKRGVCDSCGQTEKLNRYVDQGSGTVYWLCDTCYNLAKIFTWH